MERTTSHFPYLWNWVKQCILSDGGGFRRQREAPKAPISRLRSKMTFGETYRDAVRNGFRNRLGGGASNLKFEFQR